MTIAVCYKCGKFKHGAFTTCENCESTPVEDDDLVMSLALTDHYFDQPTLNTMSAEIKKGEKLKLNPATHKNLLEMIHAPGMANMLRMIKGGASAKSSKRPWWQVW